MLVGYFLGWFGNRFFLLIVSCFKIKKEKCVEIK